MCKGFQSEDFFMAEFFPRSEGQAKINQSKWQKIAKPIITSISSPVWI